MKCGLRRSGLIAAMMVLTLAAQAEVREFAVKGFVISEELTLPVSPDTLFNVMTGDIRGWWDHSFSDSPKALFIEPTPGGGFFELFDDAGNGVKHATVIYAERGKRLRFEGPLGLSGKAVVFVTTWDYEAAPGGTLLKLTVSMSGQIEEGFEQTIAGVWHHFLVERLKPYVESGRYLEKFKTGK
jgi:hypothetical protein